MRALITGITGQDGSYLAELLLHKGYKVYGLVRRTSQENFDNIEHIKDKLTLITGDLTDQASVNRAIVESLPDEVYNLGAQSFVGASFQIPLQTADVTGLGTLRLLEALRLHNPKAKFYQASSSEMFGDQGGLLNEQSLFKPRSPYGTAKVFAHNTAVNYREAYDMFVCCGILFNHESPRRGKEFVTRKVTEYVKQGDFSKKLQLGNLDAKRDWGHARDYVYGMWLMLQQNSPDDYVLATGKAHSIKELCQAAFASKGLNWEDHVEVNPEFVRPSEIDVLLGDNSKATEKLGWEPLISFGEMITGMVNE